MNDICLNLKSELNSLDLLAQNQFSILKDRNSKRRIIRLIISIYQEAIEAIEAFINEKYHLFDAQVGETSCQIRAYKILLLSRPDQGGIRQNLLHSVGKSFRKNRIRLYGMVSKFEKIIELEGGNYNKYLDKPISINCFFSNVTICLTAEVYFIIQCYVLQKYSLKCSENMPTSMDYKNMMAKLHITRTQAQLLIHYYQKSIAEKSCEFILKLTNSRSINPTIKIMMPYLQMVADEERQILPCYLVTEVILNHALENKIPIILLVKRFIKKDGVDNLYFLFVSNEEKSCFLLEERFVGELTKACMVIKGIALYDYQEDIVPKEEYRKEILRLGLKNIILYNMAKHPQYIGKKLELLVENPFPYFYKTGHFSSCAITLNQIQGIEKRLLDDKRMAEIKGCCLNSPNLFLLKHIYCDLVGNLLTGQTENKKMIEKAMLLESLNNLYS